MSAAFPVVAGDSYPDRCFPPRMNVQTKILILLLTISTTLAGGLVAVKIFEKRNFEAIAAAREAERNRNFDEFLNERGDRLKVLVEDSSTWDEMVRAVVKEPPLLILDEPFQGLDGPTADRIRDWLDATLRPDQTLVFVTHVPAHLPRTVTRHLRLAGGRATG